MTTRSQPASSRSMASGGFAYRREIDQGDVVFTIYDVATNRDFAQTPVRLGRSISKSQAEADAAFLVASLNAASKRRPRRLQRRCPQQGPYAYGRDASGVDDLWVIYDREAGRDLASVVFWDCSPDWKRRSESDAQRIVAALNSQGASGPARTLGGVGSIGRACARLVRALQ